MPVGNKFAESQGLSYVPNDMYLQEDFKGSTPLDFSNVSSSGIMSQAPIPGPLQYVRESDGGGDGPPGAPPGPKGPSGITGFDSLGNPVSDDMSIGSVAKNALGFLTNPLGFLGIKAYRAYKDKKAKQELQDFYNTTEAKTAQDMARDNKASNTGGYQAGYGGDFMDGAGRGRGNAPSDKGGSDSMGSHADGGRVGYFFGGRVNYKAGGRTDAGANRSTASHSTRGQINEAGQQVNNNSGNDGGDTKPTFYGKNNNIVTTDFISKNPNLTVDYTDPRNYASVYGKIGFNNILDNDDITAEGNVTGKLGSIGYNTNFTDQGITGTNLTAGNFNANLNPDMQVQNIGYNNNINGINYGVNTDFDNTMLTAGVNFKNGGLASIL